MPITDNIVAAYKFSDSGSLTTDSSGNGKTLTNTNSVSATTGWFGGGGAFAAASSQYMTITDAVFNLGATTFTIAMWVKLASVSGRQWLCGCATSGGNGIYVIDFDAGTGDKHIYFYTGSNFLKATNFGALSAGTSYLIVARYDGSSAKSIRVNNTENSTTQGGSGSTSAFSIGRGGEYNGIYADATFIDEVYVWSRVLTDGECDTLWNSGAGTELFASSGSLVKTSEGLAIASVKTFNGLATASVKTVMGLTNV